MIDMVPVLPKGVLLHEHSLEDKALQQDYPMNTTAQYFLSLVDGKRSLSSLAVELAKHYQQSEETITPDILSLCQKLQQNRLLNVRGSWRQFLFRWLIALQTRTIPPIYGWRSDLPETTNIVVLFFWTCLIVLRAWIPLICLVSIIGVGIGCMLGNLLPFAAYLALTWVCVVSSIALHEASHLIVLRRLQGYTCGFFVHTIPYIHLVRPPQNDLRSEAMISLAGPLAPTVVALGMLAWHFLHGSLVDWMVIAIFGIHALQLIIPNRDLSNIFRLVRLARR